jgi:hypothetical protein
MNNFEVRPDKDYFLDRYHLKSRKRNSGKNEKYLVEISY